jgi:hypothetical protein
MGLATHPSGSVSSERSVSWLKLPPSSSSLSPSGSPPTAGMSCGGAGGHLWLRCRGRWPLRLHLPLRRGGKSPAAPAPGVGAPAPRAGDDVVSPGDWTDLAPCDAGDALPGRKAKRESQTYVQCT